MIDHLYNYYIYCKSFSFFSTNKYFFPYRDIGVPNAWEFRKDNEKYQLDFTAPGVEVHCLYGSKVDTVEKFVYYFLSNIERF